MILNTNREVRFAVLIVVDEKGTREKGGKRRLDDAARLITGKPSAHTKPNKTVIGREGGRDHGWVGRKGCEQRDKQLEAD